MIAIILIPFVLWLHAVNAQVSNATMATNHDTDNVNTNVRLSLLLLTIPIIVGLAAVTVSARNFIFKYTSNSNNEAKPMNSGDLTSSLDTSDSSHTDVASDVQYTRAKMIITPAMWNTLKNYKHIAKLECDVDEGDEERGGGIRAEGGGIDESVRLVF